MEGVRGSSPLSSTAAKLVPRISVLSLVERRIARPVAYPIARRTLAPLLEPQPRHAFDEETVVTARLDCSHRVLGRCMAQG